MKTRLAVACVSVVIFGLASSIVSAQLITPVSQSRSIAAESSAQSSSSFAPFNASVTGNDGEYYSTSADQNSQINTSSIIASGDASVGEGPLGHGLYLSANSLFSVTFTLAVPCSMTLTGSGVAQSGAASLMSLSGPAGTVFQSSGYANYSTNGLLTAGQYVISDSAYASTFVGHGSYSLDLELTAVPEPSTVALVGLGLTALLVRRTKRTTGGRV